MSTRGTMTFRIAEETKEELRKIAERDQRSLAWMVERAVKELVERERLDNHARRNSAGKSAGE